jgi:hypothetical protein
MPSRELMNRLVEINNWKNIPKVDKYGKKVWLYYKSGRTYKRGIFISYQEDEALKDMCKGVYQGNVLLRVPSRTFFKKFKGRDKIYLDPNEFYIKDMKKMVRGYKPKSKEEKSVSKSKKGRVSRSRKGGNNVLLNF